jgi:hypothetical protein
VLLLFTPVSMRADELSKSFEYSERMFSFGMLVIDARVEGYPVVPVGAAHVIPFRSCARRRNSRGSRHRGEISTLGNQFQVGRNSKGLRGRESSP